MASISGSQPALMFNLAGVGRAGATRAGHHSAKVFISINAVQRAEARADQDARVLVESLRISESEGGTPNTAALTTVGFPVSTGHEVIATLGSINNLDRLFGGTVLKINKGFIVAPDTPSRELHVVDYTWQLNGRKVIGRYSGSVTTIVTTIMTAYAPDVNLSKVEAGLDSIDEITFAEPVDLTVALSRLASRIGARWLMDYRNRLHFGVSDVVGLTNPRELNTSNPTFQMEDFGPIELDRSQQITRVSMEGGGSNAATAVAVGETILPLEDAPETWYGDTGGVVVAGPQRLTYTGRQAGGGGTLVGSGASPSVGPSLALASSTGVDSGAHSYAATFVTASGESLPSPLAAIAVGTLSAPSTAPTAGTPTVGSGVTTGNHQYAVTFVNSAGETTTSPLSGSVTTGPVTTGSITDPASAPTPGTPSGGTGPDVGAHDYAVTFINGSGETAGGPTANVTTGNYAAPSYGGTANNATAGGSIPVQSAVQYLLTFVTATGETTGVGIYNFNGTTSGFQTIAFTSIETGPTGVTARKLYRIAAGGFQYQLLATISDNTTTTYNDSADDSALGALYTGVNTARKCVVGLSNIPVGGTGTTGRRIYRTVAGGSQLKFVATISNNTATTYSDAITDASLGANIPTSNTTAATVDYNVVPLTNIPLGAALVTSRKLYRTTAGGSQMKLLATIADNTTTTYTDSTADASIGANIPTSNTAAANRVSVSAIPIGAAAVTSRKLYRTVAAGSQLKLLATIADNTTTTYADSTADASLGANVPTSDTSGLTQPTGQVVAGATAVPVAYWGGALPTAGWAIIGNGKQVIRYTGVSGGTSLTGIPASGAGSITASISYNTTITACPQLIGIPASGAGAIAYAIVQGDEINRFVTADDVLEQAALSALLDPLNTLSGAAGIIEDILRDRRLSHGEALERAEAKLALVSGESTRFSYSTLDKNTAPNRTVVANIASPTSFSGTFRIHGVTKAFTAGGGLFPRCTVQASDQLYTFEQLLNQGN